LKITSTDQQIIRNQELSKANGKTQTNTAQNIDENVLAILLKMADKRSVILGSSGTSSKTDGQEDAS